MTLPSAGPPPTTTTSAQDRGFYRTPARVAVLAFLAPLAYEFWWVWQLFKFSRREGFPRARAFWWFLVPIYGWFVVYYQLDDLKKQLSLLPTPAAFSAVGATWPVILSHTFGSATNRTNGLTSFAFFVLSGIFIAAAAFVVQRAANVYQEARYPGRPLGGMTRGEAIATVIGVVIFLLVLLGTVLPT